MSDEDETRRLRYLLEHSKTCPFKGGADETLYLRVDIQRKQFEEFSKDPSRDYAKAYYEGMASGLAVALQEIDRKRYEREAKR